MVELVKHFWNGRFGRLARRDIYIRQVHDGVYEVEVRHGGSDGQSALAPHPTSETALAAAQEVMSADAVLSQWRDITEAHRTTVFHQARQLSAEQRAPGQPGDQR